MWSKQRHIFICSLCQKSLAHNHNIWFVTSYIEHAMILYCMWHHILNIQWYHTACDMVYGTCNDITLHVTWYIEHAMILHGLWHCILNMQWYHTACDIIYWTCNDIALLETLYIEHAMISHCMWHHILNMQWHHTACDITVNSFWHSINVYFICYCLTN